MCNTRNSNFELLRILYMWFVIGGHIIMKYDKGLFDLNEIKVLITSGLGTGDPKLPRFNNVPEVVNLKITNK